MLPSERLKLAIASSGYSYKELGNLTGIAKSSIQRYASGETEKIPIDAVDALASVLGVSATYITGWDDDDMKKKTPHTEAPHLTVDDEIAKYYTTLSPERKKIVLDLVRNLSALEHGDI